ncbi:MAG: ABC transporter permease [Thermodesulfobacteriota bacterium]
MNSSFAGFAAKACAFLRRDLLIALSYRLQFFIESVGIFFTSTTLFLAARLIDGQGQGYLAPYGGDFFSFVIIGVALTDYLMITTNAFASEIRKSQVVGTLEALLVSPTSINTILSLSLLYTMLTTSLRVFAYLGLGILFFDMKLELSGLGPLLIAFSATLLPFIGIGLLSAAFIIAFKQGSPIAWLMGVSNTLLAGVLYPVSVLPEWLRPVSALLPLTHGLEAIRQVMLNGAGLTDIGHQLTTLTIFALLFLVSGLWAIKKSLEIARRDGSLLHY